MAFGEILLAGYSGKSQAGKIAPSCPLGQPITARNFVHLARSRSQPYNKTSSRQAYDMTQEYSLESLNFVVFTKLNKPKMRSKGFFYNLADLFSNTFATVGEFQRLLQSFSIRFSQHDRTVLHVIQRERAQAPLHLSHKFFDVKSFYKILPLLPTVIAKSR